MGLLAEREAHGDKCALGGRGGEGRWVDVLEEGFFVVGVVHDDVIGAAGGGGERAADVDGGGKANDGAADPEGK